MVFHSINLYMEHAHDTTNTTSAKTAACGCIREGDDHKTMLHPINTFEAGLRSPAWLSVPGLLHTAVFTMEMITSLCFTRLTLRCPAGSIPTIKARHLDHPIVPSLAPRLTILVSHSVYTADLLYTRRGSADGCTCFAEAVLVRAALSPLPPWKHMYVFSRPPPH